MYYFLFNPISKTLITRTNDYFSFNKIDIKVIGQIINECYFVTPEDAKYAFYNLRNKSSITVNGEIGISTKNISLFDFKIYSFDESLEVINESFLWKVDIAFDQTDHLKIEDIISVCKTNLRHQLNRDVLKLCSYDENLEYFLRNNSLPEYIILYDTEQGCNSLIKELKLSEEKVFSQMTMLSCARGLKKLYNLPLSEIKYKVEPKHGYYFMFKTNDKADLLSAKLSSHINFQILNLRSIYNEIMNSVTQKEILNITFDVIKN